MKATELTQKAFQLNPQNAGVHYQLANISFFTECSYRDSFNHASKAIEMKPNYPEAQQYMAFLYLLAGKTKKAYEHLHLALSIDPFNLETLFYNAYYHYRTGDYEKALNQFEALLTKNPRNIPVFIVLNYALLKLGRYDDVLTKLKNIPEEMVIPDELLGIRCLVNIFKGDKTNTDLFMKRLNEESIKPMSFQAHSYLFMAYANLGKFDAAFKWLEESLKMKSSIFLLSYSDPLVDQLKNDPRYPIFHQRLYPEIELKEFTGETKPPLLDDETSHAYLESVLAYLKNQTPYLNPELTLRSLAEQVSIHPNQLSWLLNEKIRKNFNEFINHYRVEHFKILAKDPANAHISLIGLAYESGFNSKTVFNTFFKKETGMTPSGYLKHYS
jgi:adenylate cyclase